MTQAAFQQPLNCDRKGCEASLYLDLSWGGTMDGAGAATDPLDIKMSDLSAIYTAWAGRSHPIIAYGSAAQFALIETVQGDIVVNNAGNLAEKPTRTGLNRTWTGLPGSETVESVVQNTCCYNHYIRAKRDLEITFDLAVDADYAPNEILFDAMCSKLTVAILYLSGLINNPNQIGFYGEWLIDTGNENEPASGDTMHNMSIRPAACAVVPVQRVRTEEGSTSGISVINSDTGALLWDDLDVIGSAGNNPMAAVAGTKEAAERMQAVIDKRRGKGKAPVATEAKG